LVCTGVTRLRLSQSRDAPPTPVVMPGDMMPKPPGSGLQTHPQAPPSLPCRDVPPRHVLHRSEDCNVTRIETNVKQASLKKIHRRLRQNVRFTEKPTFGCGAISVALGPEANIQSVVWTGNSDRNRSLTARHFRASPAASCPVSCCHLQLPQPTGCIPQYTPAADRVPDQRQGQSPCTSRRV
jgi:hypothetical protein